MRGEESAEIVASSPVATTHGARAHYKMECVVAGLPGAPPGPNDDHHTRLVLGIAPLAERRFFDAGVDLFRRVLACPLKLDLSHVLLPPPLEEPHPDSPHHRGSRTKPGPPNYLPVWSLRWECGRGILLVRRLLPLDPWTLLGAEAPSQLSGPRIV